MYDKSRVVFVIIGDRIKVANITDSHADWFRRLGLPDASIEVLTRGYVDDKGIFFYRTWDFIAESEDVERMKKVLPQLLERMPRLTDNVDIFAGYPVGAIQRYIGTARHRKVGTVGSLLK